MEINEKYMRRALQLAANGRGSVSPNPMVGAVIVAPDGEIIGEGWHRIYGQGHAEVNAVASVADESRLREATMYVTLEPCSHYGKTPPCAKLIVDKRIPRVVVGAMDPNPKVSGRGVAMLREAGVEVATGVLAEESMRLNCCFMTAHTQKRPFITLKLACSADGYMDAKRDVLTDSAFRFSNEETSISTMKLRSLHDAVLTSVATLNADRCRLTVRGWEGRQPLRIILDRRGLLEDRTHFIYSTPDYGFCDGDGSGLIQRPVIFDLGDSADLADIMHTLFADRGVTSLLVEAGPTLLGEFIRRGLWDAMRVEVAPVRLGERGAKPCPPLPLLTKTIDESVVGGNRLIWLSNNPLFVSPF